MSCLIHRLLRRCAPRNDNGHTQREEEAVSKAAFYRRVAEAQRKYTLIINSLRLCVSAVIKKCTLLIQPLPYISANVVIARAKPEATPFSHRHRERNNTLV
jgi:hypothetical protein